MSRSGDGPVWVDAAALQSPMSRGRGIARYAEQWALALERERPDLVGRYVLDPALAPPRIDEELLATGKVGYAGTAPGTARVVHTLSPFDLEVGLDSPWPAWAHQIGAWRSATVYDLIPASDPEANLADPLVRRRYQTRLELVRSSDQLHTISRAVAAACAAMLRVPPERLVLAGAAPAPWFRPDHSRDALGPARALVGDRDFVLAPGGSHPRKNTERLLHAWAALPSALKERFALVLTGSLPASTLNHYRHLAHEGGFADQLIVGELSDETLLSCYRAATLVCVPSLAEGYGYPVAEAIACATPVIASDRPPIDELLRPLARFDPETSTAITSALVEALATPASLARIGTAALGLRTPEDMTAATITGFEALLGRPSRPRPRAGGTGGPRRLRLAVVSPFPPAPSGVAAYSYRLVEELLAAGAVVDAYSDGPTAEQMPPPGATPRAAATLRAAEQLLGRYDAVVYALGNSHHHLGALALLRERPGIVIAHDVRLANCYRHEHGDPAFARGGFAKAVATLYPEPGLDSLLSAEELDEVELARSGPLMAREAIAASTAFLVTSTEAADLARLDARPEDAAKIAVLPFAIEDPASHRALFATDDVAARARTLAGEPLICHFGIVDPVKLPDVLLEAIARLRRHYPALTCAFVGPAADEVAAELRARASELGCDDCVVLTGPLDPAHYRAALGAATVAVQLRAQFNGEASAAVGECLATGVPTVVSRVGWARSLPSDAVAALEAPADPGRLAELLDAILADPARRAALSRAGQREAVQRSFAATAAALLEVARAETKRHGLPAPDDARSPTL